jgi:hypothetical protein
MDSAGTALVDLSKMIAGKTVAIVGNATSLCALSHGAQIDQFDIVIRMNRGRSPALSSHGKRTDILAFSIYSAISDIGNSFGARALVHMSPRRRDRSHPDAAFYPLDWWAPLAQTLGARPSTGAMVADLVHRLAPATATLFGFDGYRSSSFYLDAPHVGPHDYLAESAFLRTLVARTGWAVGDVVPD